MQVEQGHGHLAASVHINLITHQEGVVVDHGASVQALDGELDTVIHVGIDLDEPILHDLHHMRALIYNEQLLALVKLGEGHRKDDLVDGLVRHIPQILNTLQSALQEDLDLIIVLDGPLEQLVL